MTNLDNKSLKGKTNFNFIIILLIIIIISGYTTFTLTRPMPKLSSSTENITSPTLSGNFSWPSYGQSAIGAQGVGLMATHGDQTSKPIASIAKTILALAIIEEKPINVGEQGPNIPITQADVDLYKEAVKQNGSNVPVALGSNLTEYRALQALLVPSGDNIAETLAIWVFGSQQKYLDYVNTMLASWGLNKTHMADASGLSPQTVSSAKDLVAIGEKVIDNPVLAEIVNQQEVDLPIVGKVKNYNTLLGQNGVIGIKTGNTDEAGGCLLFAYKKNIDQKNTTLIGVILGAPNRYQALIDTTSFIKNNENNYKYLSAIKKDQIVGSITTPWGDKINVVAKNDLPLLMVPSEKVELSIKVDSINKYLDKDAEVGTITATYNENSLSTPAILGDKISPPSMVWKLLHP